MKSRAAYRDKARGTGQLRPKTRVVIIGCMDPDLKALTRDSPTPLPTPTRLSEMLILAIATAGANRAFNFDGEVWKLWLSDAEKAFLQGKQDLTERGGQPWFMEPPRDPILRDAGAYPATSIQDHWQWVRTLKRTKGVVQPRSGKGFGKQLRAAFFWPLSFLSPELQERCWLCHDYPRGRFHGDLCWVISFEDSGRTLLLGPGDQGGYQDSWPISWKGDQDALKRKAPMSTRFRRLSLSSIWMTVNYPLEGYRKVAIFQRLKWRSFAQWWDACSGSEANQGLTSVLPLPCVTGERTPTYQTSRCSMTTSPMPSGPLRTVSFFLQCRWTATQWSSWANAQNHTSQFGTLTMLRPPQVKDTTSYGMLVDWKSGRSTRVCRSTLAAEASAADESTDRASYVNLFLSEILTTKPAYRGAMILEQLQVTDAKSLYDCLIAENPVISDKRSMINIRSVQQVVKPSNVHWVPTKIMHCDGLTKLDKQLQENLRKWCMKPWCQLRDDNSMSKQRPVWNLMCKRSL